MDIIAEENTLNDSNVSELSGAGATKSGILRCSFNLFRAMVGVGFLTLPILVVEVGTVIFVAISLVATFSVYYGITLIVDVAEDMGYQGGSYEKVVQKVFKNDTLDFIVKTSVVMLQLSNCIANIIFISKKTVLTYF